MVDKGNKGIEDMLWKRKKEQKNEKNQKFFKKVLTNKKMNDKIRKRL